MPKQIQRRYTQGELDPKVIGRADLDQYYGGAETMTNVITLTQGGFKRRGGLEYIGRILGVTTFVSAPTITAPNGGTGSNANDQNTATALLTTTNISTTNPYVVVHYDVGSQVDMGVVYIYGLALTVAGTSSQFYVQVSTDNSTWVNAGDALSLTTTAKNYSRRIHGTYRYLRLARIGSADLTTSRVTLNELNLYTESPTSSVRIVDFQFNTEQSYIMVFTHGNVAIYLDGVLQIDVVAGGIENSRLPTLNWAQSADTLVVFQEEINPKLIQRQGADDAWAYSDLAFDSIPYHAFTEVEQTGAAAGFGTLTPSAVTGTITLTVSAGTFTAASVGQYAEGNGGLARIIGYTSATVVTAYVEIPFFNTTAIAAASWNYLTGYEAVWSSTRGWPICGTFHNGRLWIGGSRDRPTTVWGSRVGIPFDFSLGTALDDEGIEASIDTDQLNRIINIYSGRNLMVFTSGAEFVVPSSSNNDPITPSNVSFLRQSRIGAFEGLRVHEIEGGVFYVQNGGQSIQEFVYVDTQQAYSNNFISLLSTHLIQDPVDTCVRRATSTDEGTLYVMVRGDGGCTIGAIQRSQQIAAFTNQTTDGTFIACGADYNDLYFAVTRNSINYLERINDDHLLDASVRYTTGLPLTTFTGLDHLEGETVAVLTNKTRAITRAGSYFTDTISGGESTFLSAFGATYQADEWGEVGLVFTPLVKDLPTEFPEQKTVLGRLLNVAEVNTRFYDTHHAKINTYAAIISQVASTANYTGLVRMQGFTGWDETGQVTITQSAPAELTVLAMEKTILQSS